VKKIAIDLVPICASITILGAAWFTAWAEKEIATAVIAAATEKEELIGRGLILTVIPETIVIFGLIVAIMIIGLGGKV